MRSKSLVLAMVLASLSISSSSALTQAESPWQDPKPRRRRQDVQKWASYTSPELQAWNKAVEAKKDAKRLARMRKSAPTGEGA
jgi:hypothetical protein